jgi:hypothetical protein
VELADRFHQHQVCSVGVRVPSPRSQCASADIQDSNVFDENALCIGGLVPKGLNELLRLTLGQC